MAVVYKDKGTEMFVPQLRSFTHSLALSSTMVQLTQFVLATAALAGAVSAAPKPTSSAAPKPPVPSAKPPTPLPIPSNATVNPWPGKDRYVVQSYSKKLDQTIAAFKAKNDTLNAARTRTVAQKVSTFHWVTTRAMVSSITTVIKEARSQRKGSKRMIVGLVLYNLPDRDCSAGESAGELSIAKDGLNLYKKEFIDAYAKAVSSAPDLDFAIVLEPDSLGNAITNQGVPFCATATPVYEVLRTPLPNCSSRM
jgi:cellulose 1,4-beta-cellobiosidase